MNDEKPCQPKIPDRELWRESDHPFAARVFLVSESALAIEVGGYVIVKDLRGWHDLAKDHDGTKLPKE